MPIKLQDGTVVNIYRGRWAVSFFAIAIALVAPSWSRPNPVASTEAARAALETSLAAWRDGKKPGDTARSDPPVHSTDGEWYNGRKLAAFEVLREQPSQGDKRFVVRLKYPDKPAEAEVVYVVLNTRPHAVFREEDFNRGMNMENNPVAKKKKR